MLSSRQLKILANALVVLAFVLPIVATTHTEPVRIDWTDDWRIGAVNAGPPLYAILTPFLCIVAAVALLRFADTRDRRHSPSRRIAGSLGRLLGLGFLYALVLAITIPNLLLASARVHCETARLSGHEQMEAIAESGGPDAWMPLLHHAGESGIPAFRLEGPYSASPPCLRDVCAFDPRSSLALAVWDSAPERRVLAWSRGPDYEFTITTDTLRVTANRSDTEIAQLLAPLSFDPTNGTTSAGDIWVMRTSDGQTLDSQSAP